MKERRLETKITFSLQLEHRAESDYYKPAWKLNKPLTFAIVEHNRQIFF